MIESNSSSNVWKKRRMKLKGFFHLLSSYALLRYSSFNRKQLTQKIQALKINKLHIGCGHIQGVQIEQDGISRARGTPDRGDQEHFNLAPMAGVIQALQGVAGIVDLARAEHVLVQKIRLQILLERLQAHAHACLFNRQCYQCIGRR